MNLPTIFIGLFVIALFLLAVRHLLKNGTCAGCSEKKSAHSGCNGCCHGDQCGMEPKESKQ